MEGVPTDFFLINTITIPLSQVALLLIAAIVVLLFGRTKLALVICYLFTLYWGYFANADQLKALHNPGIVIASEAKQSHNMLIIHKIATALCASQ